MQKLTALLLILFTWYNVSAQISNSSFLHYTTDQGLSNDHITAIAKDRLGFLWIGTTNGLNRFDGRTFTIFRHDPKDIHSIPHDNISAITLAPDGLIWVSTTGGLCKIDPYWLNIVRIHLPENDDTLDNDLVNKVAFDSKGMAWTTGYNGIYKINPVTDKPDYFLKTESTTLGWFGILIDPQDRVWLLKDVLNRFDPVTQQFKVMKGVNPKEPFEKGGVLSVVMDDTGEIWAGTWATGIWKYNADQDAFEKTSSPQTLSVNVLPDVLPSGTPFLWVGGGKSGLATFNPETKEFFQFKPDPQDPFTHNNYLAVVLFKDSSNGDVWIGTEVGLEQYAPATIRFGRAMIPVEKDMGQFSLVSGVVNDNTDTIGSRYFISVWGSGLFTWNKTTGNFTRITFAKSRLSGLSYFNLFQDHHGYIWACMTGGMGRFDPRTNTWRDYEKFFQHNELHNLFWCGLEDHAGNVWFGSNKEGLYRYNPHTDNIELVFFKKEFVDHDGIINIMGMSEDSLGRLWLACSNSGLIRYDPATKEAIQIKLNGHNVSQVCNDVETGSHGRVYAAFYSQFFELDSDGNVLKQFDEQNGLKTNRIYFIVKDKQGKIWFNSVYLLHCYDPETGTFTYYGKPDGLFSNTMTDGLSITPGGEIFVGFQNAFNFFYPDRLRRNLQPPLIAITSIKVMNKERMVTTYNDDKIGLPDSLKKNNRQDTFLTLNPGEDFFEIEFAAITFNQQERNRYAYLLEGFNKDWVYTDRPVATFTNLDGGTYFLHMKAANNDGIWNEKSTPLEIRVHPPLSKSKWFPVIVILALGGMMFGFLLYRRQQRHRLEKFRESLARDLHDEMGSTLSSIRFFSDFADQQIGMDKPLISPVLQRISQSASNLSESMQDIIWAMKTDHDQLEDLESHMMEFALRILESRNINFKTHISEDFPGKQIQPVVRRNIYLIFKEAVNNIAKYSEATQVEMYFTLTRGKLLMKISDNGKGFDIDNSPSLGTGNGLKNMRKRAMDIGGKLDIRSNSGEGTTVELQVEV